METSSSCRNVVLWSTSRDDTASRVNTALLRVSLFGVLRLSLLESLAL